MLLIRCGDFLKHKDFMDVCIRVEKVFRAPRSTKMRVAWINIRALNSEDIRISQRLEIRNENLKDWSVAIDANKLCWSIVGRDRILTADGTLRNCQWKPLR